MLILVNYSVTNLNNGETEMYQLNSTSVKQNKTKLLRTITYPLQFLMNVLCLYDVELKMLKYLRYLINLCSVILEIY